MLNRISARAYISDNNVYGDDDYDDDNLNNVHFLKWNYRLVFGLQL